MSPRPRMVLITGSPGSGKTTLATALSARLRMLHISKDRITSGLALTDPSRSADDLSDAAWERFWQLLETLLADGVSVVAEQTFWRGRTEESARRLGRIADVLNLHTRCAHALDRWEVRLRAEEVPLPMPFAEFVVAIRQRADEFTEPLDLGCLVIEVDTTDGYEPSLDALVAAIMQR